MDGGRYGSYKSLSGSWDFHNFTLEIGRAQADPFAPPTRMSVRVSPRAAGIPDELADSAVRRRALTDYLVRAADRELRDKHFKVDSGEQEVLERSACRIEDGLVLFRFGFGLPGNGRKIDGSTAQRLLCRVLPAAMDASLRWQELDQDAVREFVSTVEDSTALRDSLEDLGLVAFVADGSVLPRRSGVDDRALADDDVVTFTAPPSLRTEVELPNRGWVAGMGVPEGISLVVGGGFHGKSTLLRSLERGVYDHVPGDGRELVVSRTDTVKVRAEDGRAVHQVDVSPFVDHLPTGSDTSRFRSENASGSTSQAANIVEAVEAGAGVLLVDEDTTATNLMIRDARMQELVAKDREPLTPFVDLVRPLYRDRGVSTVLVMGGSGDYLDVASRVLMMDAYRPYDVSERAAELASAPTERRRETDTFPVGRHRCPDPKSISAEAKGKTRIKGRGTEELVFGENTVDLRGVEQLVDPSQIIGIGLALQRLTGAGHLDGKRTITEALDLLENELDDGIGGLQGGFAGDFAVPRRFEVAAALNRLRNLRIAGFRHT